MKNALIRQNVKYPETFTLRKMSVSRTVVQQLMWPSDKKAWRPCSKPSCSESRTLITFFPATHVRILNQLFEKRFVISCLAIARKIVRFASFHEKFCATCLTEEGCNACGCCEPGLSNLCSFSYKVVSLKKCNPS